MSLNTLIRTVITNFSIDEKKALECLLKLENAVGRIEFTKVTLMADQFTTQEAEKLPEILVTTGYAIKYFNYRCYETDFVENTPSGEGVCDACNQSLDDEMHEVIEMYELNEELFQELKNKKEAILMEVVMEGYRPNLELLRKRKRDIVPFLGAGVATPLGVPGWRRLLSEMKVHLKNESLHKRYVQFFDAGDYLSALSYLKRNSLSLSTDEQIKAYIVQEIKEKLNLTLSDDQHNLKDLARLDSDFYLTTNYETSIKKFVSNDTVPLVLTEVEDVYQLMREQEQRTIHLHGIVDKPRTMIVTKEDYDALYNNQEYKLKMSAIMANKVLLFIGWSFTDEFFKDLFTKIQSMVGGEHFIIAPNIDDYDAQEWAKSGLRTIGIKVDTDDYGYNDRNDLVIKIRKVLEAIIE